MAGLAAADDLACWVVGEGFYEVRATDWPVLRLLHTGPLGMCALAAPQQITQQAASKAIASLEARGYVRRTKPASDRRRRLASLTGHGQALLAAAAAWASAQQEAAVARWGPANVRRTSGLLVEFAEGADHMRGPGRRLRPPAG